METDQITDIKFFIKLDSSGKPKPLEYDTHMLYLDCKHYEKACRRNGRWKLPYTFSAEYVDIKHYTWQPTKNCIYAFRGMNKNGFIKKCIESKIDYFYSDTGYLEFMRIVSYRSKQTRRMVYNGLHETSQMRAKEIFEKLNHLYTPEELKERFLQFSGQSYDNFKLNNGNKIVKGDAILIVVPSGKSCKYYDTTEEEWLQKTKTEIKKYTDRPIVVRKKPHLNKRRRKPLVEDLASGKYHAMVTFNSIASLESVMMGVPVICLGENAGSALGEAKMENIETPYFPKINKIRDHFLFLSCQQYTIKEMIKCKWLKIMHALKGDEINKVK